MAIRKSIGTSCVVNDRRGTQSPGADRDPRAFTVVDTARRLIALGLSTDEVEELGLEEPTLRSIREYARLDDDAGQRPSADAVDAALKSLGEEMRKVDLELEMLGMRRRALTNRAKLLHKLADTLEQRDRSLAIDPE